MTSELPTITIDFANDSLIESEDIFPTKSCCKGCSLKETLINLRCSSNYWQSRHKDAVLREICLKTENENLQARIRYLENQLYGHKNEQHVKSELRPKNNEPKRKRGQQVGHKSHGRRDYSNLPASEEEISLDDKLCFCTKCGLPFLEMPDTEDGEILTIEVKGYRRIYRRKKYTPSCSCPGNKGIITAPVPAKLIPKTGIDVPIFVEILIEKYLYQRPLSRTLSRLANYGLNLPIGTVCDNLIRLFPLFEPLRDAIHEKSLQESWWHADETRWSVFELTEDKKTYRWYVWVFLSESTVVYVLAPGRGSDVVEDYFGSKEDGFLCVDRYSAYKCFVKTHTGFILVFCWAHVRRDFLDVGKTRPELEDWSLSWVNRIGELYILNNNRVKYADDTPEFKKYDKLLHDALTHMCDRRDTELNNPTLHTSCRKVLKSLENHWHGLTVFLEHPHLPMDNNPAERKLRNNAVGRKNYYGSVTCESGYFTMTLFSIFQTLLMWEINPYTWLTRYLWACAENGGQVFPDISRFLPWKMSEDDLVYYRHPPPINMRK